MCLYSKKLNEIKEQLSHFSDAESVGKVGLILSLVEKGHQSWKAKQAVQPNDDGARSVNAIDRALPEKVKDVSREQTDDLQK